MDAKNTMDWACQNQGNFKKNEIKMTLRKRKVKVFGKHEEEGRLGKFDTPITSKGIRRGRELPA